MLTEIESVVRDLGLSIAGSASSPNEGRIAKNFIVPTVEIGPVLIRIRPLASGKNDTLLEYGLERFEFEANVIDFLSKTTLPVPNLLSFKSTGATLYKSKDYYAFCYPLLPGHPIGINEINTEIAEDAGRLVRRLIEVAATYDPDGHEPDGDIDYIGRIFRRAIAASCEKEDQPEIRAMLDHLNNLPGRRALDSSPRGIVHGDFFFENIIHNGEKIVGLIDFGDAYVGNLLMDITTGSMEFSVDADERWDSNRFSAFLAPVGLWLKTNEIAFDTFRYSLLANCIRFSAHTHSLGVAAGNKLKIANNSYTKRFFAFRDELRIELMSIYHRTIELAKST